MIPERPAATEEFMEAQLMELVMTELMMGVALADERGLLTTTPASGPNRHQ